MFLVYPVEKLIIFNCWFSVVYGRYNTIFSEFNTFQGTQTTLTVTDINVTKILKKYISIFLLTKKILELLESDSVLTAGVKKIQIKHTYELAGEYNITCK